LDTPVEDGLSEFAEELLSKRLGLSATVAMQLREYEGMVRRDAPADSSHVEALLRLVGSRPDADLVFADAGRRAARRAVRRLFVLTRPGARPAPCSPVTCGARATSPSRAWATRSPYRRRPTAPPARCTAPGSPSCSVSSSASKALCPMSPAGRPAARCASGGPLRPIRDT